MASCDTADWQSALHVPPRRQTHTDCRSSAAYRAAATVTPPPQITAATISGGSISITWTGGGAVEFTSALGPGATWTSTGNASGSFSETVAATGNKFYRIKR